MYIEDDDYEALLCSIQAKIDGILYKKYKKATINAAMGEQQSRTSNNHKIGSPEDSAELTAGPDGLNEAASSKDLGVHLSTGPARCPRLSSFGGSTGGCCLGPLGHQGVIWGSCTPTVLRCHWSGAARENIVAAAVL